MALHDSFDVRREDGTPRMLSVFAEGVVDHPPVPVVAAARTFNSPNLAVSFAILVGGLALTWLVGRVLAQLDAPPAVVAWLPMILSIGTVVITGVRVFLHRLRRWNFQVLVRDLGTRREIGRGWTLFSRVMFEPAPSADQLTVWVPDELEIPLRELAGTSVSGVAGGLLITIERHGAESLRYLAPDAQVANVINGIREPAVAG